MDSSNMPPQMPPMPTDQSASPPPINPYAPSVAALTPSLESPHTATTEEDHTLGMLVHLLAIFTGIIGVLILWLVKKDSSRFIDHHGKEALNFQLTLLVVAVASMTVGMITIIGLFVAIPLIWALGIVAFILEILACIAAHRGDWHRYPMCIRFISN